MTKPTSEPSPSGKSPTATIPSKSSTPPDLEAWIGRHPNEVSQDVHYLLRAAVQQLPGIDLNRVWNTSKAIRDLGVKYEGEKTGRPVQLADLAEALQYEPSQNGGMTIEDLSRQHSNTGMRARDVYNADNLISNKYTNARPVMPDVIDYLKTHPDADKADIQEETGHNHFDVHTALCLLKDRGIADVTAQKRVYVGEKNSYEPLPRYSLKEGADLSSFDNVSGLNKPPVSKTAGGKYFALQPAAEGRTKSGYVDVSDAKPVTIRGAEDQDIFVHRALSPLPNGKTEWAIYEGKTGLQIANGKTRQAAIASATEKIQHYKHIGRPLDSVVSRSIDTHGVSPRYKESI